MTTVATILVSACGDNETSQNSPRTTCPAEIPSGDCVTAPDVYCDYSTANCYSVLYSCVGGHWQITGSLACNPPAPTCPPKSTLLPKVGEACGYGWGNISCEFSTTCGKIGTATCNGSSYHPVSDPCIDAGSDAQGEDAADADADGDVADGGSSE